MYVYSHAAITVFSLTFSFEYFIYQINIYHWGEINLFDSSQSRMDLCSSAFCQDTETTNSKISLSFSVNNYPSPPEENCIS